MCIQPIYRYTCKHQRQTSVRHCYKYYGRSRRCWVKGEPIEKLNHLCRDCRFAKLPPAMQAAIAHLSPEDQAIITRNYHEVQPCLQAEKPASYDSDRTGHSSLVFLPSEAYQETAIPDNPSFSSWSNTTPRHTPRSSIPSRVSAGTQFPQGHNSSRSSIIPVPSKAYQEAAIPDNPPSSAWSDTTRNSTPRSSLNVRDSAGTQFPQGRKSNRSSVNPAPWPYPWPKMHDRSPMELIPLEEAVERERVKREEQLAREKQEYLERRELRRKREARGEVSRKKALEREAQRLVQAREERESREGPALLGVHPALKDQARPVSSIYSVYSSV